MLSTVLRATAIVTAVPFLLTALILLFLSAVTLVTACLFASAGCMLLAALSPVIVTEDKEEDIQINIKEI